MASFKPKRENSDAKIVGEVAKSEGPFYPGGIDDLLMSEKIRLTKLSKDKDKKASK